jgi:hypothetical protein
VAKSTDLVEVKNYAAMRQDPQSLLATIQSNIGGQKLSEFDLDRVTIPAGGGKAWTVPTLEGDEVTPTLQGVIVFWKDTRAWWDKSFEEQGGGAPPDCSSADAERATVNEDGVHPGAPSDENGLLICEACPKSQFGSDPRPGSKAQHCKLVRQLFLLTPDDLLPIVVSLPPTSVGTAGKYFLRLSRAGVPYYSVVTQIELSQEQSGGGIKYSRANFSLVERLDAESAANIERYAEALRPAFARSQVGSATEVAA